MSAARAIPAALAVFAVLTAGCGSSDSEPNPPPARLVRTPDSVEATTQNAPGDDYWTRRYGHLMTRAELNEHWQLDEAERFDKRAHRLLELRLRDRLLVDSGLTLTPPELDDYAAQPDLDACQAFLRARTRPEEERR